jgi:predicted RNA-binding Zn ribbon-like protein
MPEPRSDESTAWRILVDVRDVLLQSGDQDFYNEHLHDSVTDPEYIPELARQALRCQQAPVVLDQDAVAIVRAAREWGRRRVHQKAEKGNMRIHLAVERAEDRLLAALGYPPPTDLGRIETVDEGEDDPTLRPIKRWPT